MSVNQENISNGESRSLLKNIIMLVFITSFCALIGFSSHFFIKTKWDVEAKVDKPTITELGNYYSLFSMYQLINGDISSKPNDIVFQEFIRQLLSYDSKRVFWEESEYYKQKMIGDTREDKLLLDSLINSIKIEVSPKNNGASIEIELDNPKQAMDMLIKFIDKINLNTRDVVYNELINQWKTLFGHVNIANQLNLGPIRMGNTLGNQDWSGKLNMMKSVTPLDNKLISYRYTKMPKLPSSPNSQYLLWSMYGALLGLLLSFIVLFLRKSK